MKVELTKAFRFEAAHVLVKAPEGHKCRRPHGHSYRIEVSVAGAVDPKTGWLIEFADIVGAVRPLLEKHLDHADLNQVPGLENPTSENLAQWLWDRLIPNLPLLSRIVIHETATARCEYRGEK